MGNEQRTQSDMPIPPSEYLAEVIDELSISKPELALCAGVAHQAIEAIIQGHERITSTTALSLEDATGVSADIWLGLEKDYRLALSTREE